MRGTKRTFASRCFRKTVIAICANYTVALAQQHVDILKLSYRHTPIASLTNDKLVQRNVDMSLLLPIKLNESKAILTGCSYGYQALSIASDVVSTPFSGTTIKLGLSLKHKKGWEGTYIVLPKLLNSKVASIGYSKQIGGAVLLKYKKSKQLSFKLGVYGNTEVFGPLTTPLLGVYYKSKDGHWEVDGVLPSRLKAGYTHWSKLSLGLELNALNIGFNTIDTRDKQAYWHNKVQNIGAYLQYGLFDNSLLFKVRSGVSNMTYELYERGDRAPWSIAAFELNDNRTVLNTVKNQALFGELNIIYRFNI